MYIPAKLKLGRLLPFPLKEKLLIEVGYQIMRCIQALLDIKRKIFKVFTGE